MMLVRRCIFFMLVLPVCLFAAAEQQVTLESGTVLVGDVSLEGDSIVVTIDGAPIRVALKEIATVRPGDAPNVNQAQRLLLMALESRLIRSGYKQDPGLLAEAYRLDPEDPKITFWYAFALEKAGHGKAADEVVSAHRDDILEAYPGVGQALAERVAKRLKMVELPAALVERIDQLNKAAESMDSLTTDSPPMFAMFRVVDQHGDPVPACALKLSQGYNSELSDFDDGYFLVTSSRRRSSPKYDMKLSVWQSGFEPKSFEFTASSDQVEDIGTFVLRRYSDEDKIAVTFFARDSEGKPLQGAKITYRDAKSYSTTNSQPLTIDEQGKVTTSLFPMQYTAFATSDGMLNGGKAFWVRADDDVPVQVEFALCKLITSRMRLIWKTSASGTGDIVTEDTATADFRRGRPTSDQDWPSWLKADQYEDKLLLTIGYSPYGYPTSHDSNWVGLLKTEEPTRAFKQVDLNTVDQSRGELSAPDKSPIYNANRYLQFPVQEGDIFVGNTAYRESARNQVVDLHFKLLVESLSVDE